MPLPKYWPLCGAKYVQYARMYTILSPRFVFFFQVIQKKDILPELIEFLGINLKSYLASSVTDQAHLDAIADPNKSANFNADPDSTLPLDADQVLSMLV